MVSSFPQVIRTSEDAFRDFLFQQLGGLISKVRQHIRNYLNDIFDLIKEFWIVGSPLQPTIILLVSCSSLKTKQRDLLKYYLKIVVFVLFSIETSMKSYKETGEMRQRLMFKEYLVYIV